MSFLLDTNAVIALLNRPGSPVDQRVRRCKTDEVFLSSIVAHELYYGAYRSRHVERNLAVLDAMQFEILAFNADDARVAGEIRAILAARGRPIGAFDVLIAGQAKAQGLTLITHNTGEFARVPGLRVEDWER